MTSSALSRAILAAFAQAEDPGRLGETVRAINDLWVETYRIAYSDAVADLRAGEPMTEEDLEREAERP